MSDQSAPATGSYPDYDPVAVGRIAAVVEIREVELVHSHFERDEAYRASEGAGGRDISPEIVFDVDREGPSNKPPLCFLARFAARNLTDPSFEVVAFFRVTYDLPPDAKVSEKDVAVFAYWNVIFNAWPYFREYVSSTVNRAGLPRLVLPVLRVPRPNSL